MHVGEQKIHVGFRDQEDDGRRIFGQPKCNNAPDDLPSLAFRVEQKTVEVAGTMTINPVATPRDSA